MTLLNDDTFKDQVAIVTGGGTGLGLETATRLGRMGADVVCVSRDVQNHAILLERGEEHGFTVVSHALDVRDAKAVKQVVREVKGEFGRIDVLINNAAGNFIRPALMLAPQGLRDGHRHRAQRCLLHVPRGRACDEGHGRRDREHLGALRGVGEARCRALGLRQGGRRRDDEDPGVGVGVVRHPRQRRLARALVSEGAADRLWPSEEMEQLVKDQIPLGRFGTAREVAELVCLLASKDVPWMTGTILVADGGWSLPAPLLAADAGKVLRRRR